MNYQSTLQYLYSQLPMYQRIGEEAFKKDLTNIKALCAVLGQPQQQFKSIHIAGTNGKGSTAHILAAFLQTAGYRVGMYTSPHYKDFRERIKINGDYISEEAVTAFVAEHKATFEGIAPSFFEITVAMAFDYFAQQKVDIAIIETGLGGRLDSTNIIQPLLSIITNIGMDHEKMLGDTLSKIAGEKAGIIKADTPVIIGESQSETEGVFRKKAFEMNAPITFADMRIEVELLDNNFDSATYQVQSKDYPKLNFEALETDLVGNYHHHNLRTALLATLYLPSRGFAIDEKHIRAACLNIKGLTNLVGRWQKLNDAPLTICDSAHNEAGLRYVIKGLQQLNKPLHIVLGTVDDKDLSKILPLFPSSAHYYFCKANVPRGLAAQKLQQTAKEFQLQGQAYTTVAEALAAAQKAAQEDDCIFVGGSIFVVAEAL